MVGGGWMDGGEGSGLMVGEGSDWMDGWWWLDGWW